MIDTLRLLAGRTPGTGPQVLELKPLTVIVGPNNSGKSVLLREAFALATSQGSERLIVDQATYLTRSRSAAERFVDSLGGTLPNGSIRARNPIPWSTFDREQAIEFAMAPVASGENAVYMNNVIGPKALQLDGSGRLSLVNAQNLGNLAAPESMFARLLQEDTKRALLSKIVFEALGEYCVLDASTEGAQIVLRMSSEAPDSNLEKRLLENFAKLRSLEPIERRSDGVKAFVGVLLQVITGEPEFLAIDEPEAFLHPGLAHRLGGHLARLLGPDQRVLAATHSSQFLMGCVQSGAAVTIVRLTYERGEATARVLAADEISQMMLDPLLRSARTLEGIFYDGVVVAEADADRSFYDEIYTRSCAAGSDLSNPSILFLNAQNKQTLHRLVAPLRRLGIPAVAAIDFDFLSDGGPDWKHLLCAASVSAIERKSLSQARALIADVYRKASVEMKTVGITHLQGGDRDAANYVLTRLAQHGIFVVPNGALESWLPNLGVTGPKERWITRMFERMGATPGAEDYVGPNPDDDVWGYISQIRQWITNPGRLGMPS
jgi:energy-coupling factor transporter ATP-binding protein EcfA2